jgi:hypothetical protein
VEAAEIAKAVEQMDLDRLLSRPERPKLEEPGAVVLPPALFDELVRTSREGGYVTVLHVAVLWTVVAQIENQLPLDPRRSEIDGETLILNERATVPGVVTGSSELGSGAFRRAIDELGKWGWLTVDRELGTMWRVSRGPKLGPRSVDEVRNASAVKSLEERAADLLAEVRMWRRPDPLGTDFEDVAGSLASAFTTRPK